MYNYFPRFTDVEIKTLGNYRTCKSTVELEFEPRLFDKLFMLATVLFTH